MNQDKPELKKALDIYKEIYKEPVADVNRYDYFLDLIYDQLKIETTPILSISKESIVAIFNKDSFKIKIQSFFNMKGTVFVGCIRPGKSLSSMDCSIKNIDCIKNFIEGNTNDDGY
jgi:hypothetical protein